MKKIEVSILLPVYNVSLYIEECLISLSNQTFINFEIIAIDDGSSDNSLVLLNKYSKHEPRLFVFENKLNKGISYTLNKGLKLCKGDYILRMDGDDVSDSKRIEKKIDFLKKNPQYDVVGCSMNTIDDKGVFLGKKIHLFDQELIYKTRFLASPLSHIWMAKKFVY